MGQKDKELSQLLASIKHDIAGIRADVSQLKYERDHGVSATHVGTEAGQYLSFYFGTSGLQRRPVHVRVDGVFQTAENLSTIRAAILFVTVLDLQDRLQGESGLNNISEAVLQVFREIEGPEDSEAKLRNQVRVALYRFEEYCNGHKGFSNGNVRLQFDAKTNRLILVDAVGQEVTEHVAVEVATSNPSLESFRGSIFKRSVLDTLDKKGAVYVEGTGPFGLEQLISELYTHEHPMQSTVVFHRPVTHSYPTEVMELMNRPNHLIERSRSVVETVTTGRYQITQILNFDTIWNMIRCSELDGFKMYPKEATAAHAEAHLMNLIDLLKETKGHRTILTDVFFPFHYSTIKIEAEGIDRYYTTFFRRFSASSLGEVACLALEGPPTYHAISSGLTSWILKHPSTVSDNDRVIEFIEIVLQHLQQKGPIVE